MRETFRREKQGLYSINMLVEGGVKRRKGW
jgi:hypothetical protein